MYKGLKDLVKSTTSNIVHPKSIVGNELDTLYGVSVSFSLVKANQNCLL